ncbi:SAM-dependent methyltransferase [Burkholderia alba]|uniref:SAM-dependent methyltransferase n=1 Tax=Burkholderia alba TaxID=2683677 RepID=UPI002B05448E|nr:SAM-dependent methyltransferase [Burkholderia alba]
MSASQIIMVPIGTVSSPRVELIDDHWGSIESIITIDASVLSEQALMGLDTFSHIEVVYHLHRVPAEEIERGARHPRGRTDWPRIGILAQRAKARPNQIGVSRCQLLAVDGLKLRVRGLDAVDQTPVLDIKPYLEDFGPIGPVTQPAWSREVMKDYYTLQPAE